jgi:hypothetical protein
MTKDLPSVHVEPVEARFVSVHIHGRLDAEGATHAMNLIEAHVKDEPYFLLETVVEALDGVSPEARRILADRIRTLPRRSIVLVGGGFAQRVVAKLVLTAIVNLGGGTTKARTSAFDNSDAARAWLRDSAADWERELGVKGKA